MDPDKAASPWSPSCPPRPGQDDRAPSAASSPSPMCRVSSPVWPTMTPAAWIFCQTPPRAPGQPRPAARTSQGSTGVTSVESTLPGCSSSPIYVYQPNSRLRCTRHGSIRPVQAVAISSRISAAGCESDCESDHLARVNDTRSPFLTLHNEFIHISFKVRMI